MYLYLDESGDLGFDYENKHSSRFFWGKIKYLYTNLSLCLNLETKLYISHENSEENKGIQAVDIFCYGISRKYELKDQNWYDLFKNKIAVECAFEIKKDGSCYA